MDKQLLKARDESLVEIDRCLEMVTEQVDRYRSYDDDRLDWGHVGDLKRIAAKLKELYQ